MYTDDKKNKKHGIFIPSRFSYLHYPWRIINAPNCWKKSEIRLNKHLKIILLISKILCISVGTEIKTSIPIFALKNEVNMYRLCMLRVIQCQ